MHTGIVLRPGIIAEGRTETTLVCAVDSFFEVCTTEEPVLSRILSEERPKDQAEFLRFRYLNTGLIVGVVVGNKTFKVIIQDVDYLIDIRWCHQYETAESAAANHRIV
jgi:hypothetical protein